MGQDNNTSKGSLGSSQLGTNVCPKFLPLPTSAAVDTRPQRGTCSCAPRRTSEQANSKSAGKSPPRTGHPTGGEDHAMRNGSIAAARDSVRGIETETTLVRIGPEPESACRPPGSQAWPPAPNQQIASNPTTGLDEPKSILRNIAAHVIRTTRTVWKITLNMRAQSNASGHTRRQPLGDCIPSAPDSLITTIDIAEDFEIRV